MCGTGRGRFGAHSASVACEARRARGGDAPGPGSLKMSPRPQGRCLRELPPVLATSTILMRPGCSHPPLVEALREARLVDVAP